MHAMSKNFVFFFFNSKMARPKDGEFFLYAKFTHFLIWCKWLHLFGDLPFDVEVDVFGLFFFFFVCLFPSVIAKCCCSVF